MSKKVKVVNKNQVVILEKNYISDAVDYFWESVKFIILIIFVVIIYHAHLFK